MTTQIQNIVNSNNTKTEKIRQLLELGISRQEIARLITNNNVGFVYNVYKKYFLDSTPSQVINFIPTAFNRRFGIEIEAYNVNMNQLKNSLKAAGIEIEVEGYNHTTRPYWKIVTDSSIQGQQSFEVVSPILEGEDGINQIDIVCQVLEQTGAKVNKSCGLHIHFDAAGFNLDTWKRIYKNYAKIENTIDGFMPDSRRADTNRFCKGFKSISNFSNKINEASNLSDISRIFSNNRYFKINPTSYVRHNTCEFRQHAGTMDFRKITRWIKFLHNFVEFSTSFEIQDSTLNGLAKFNQSAIVEFYKHRTNKLAS